MAELTCLDMGLAAYEPALSLQEQLRERVRSRRSCDGYLLLVEHDPPVITLGRRGCAEDILAPPEQLAAVGVGVHRTTRGGLATCHSPGQLVAYPILHLRAHRCTLRRYVHLLEEAVIRALRRLGIEANRSADRRGVWVGDEKIAAVGVAVSRWVTWHGLALNVCPDMKLFDLIVPCGSPGSASTSVSDVLGRAVSADDVKGPLTESFAEVFSFDGVKQDSLADYTRTQRPRLPSWLRRPIPRSGESADVRGVLDELRLATVCQSARCPNRAECFARGTATFMILGDRCTRNCRFCAICSSPPGAVRQDEPQAVAEAAARMALRHVVVTSVTRDDLPDGGAGQFARTIAAVRRRVPQADVEVLTPDFLGDTSAIDTVLDARPDVFNHNVETVARLYPAARPEADYRRSLNVLARAARRAEQSRPRMHVKSGLMLGLGETPNEVGVVLADLREAGCDIVTIGQYLAPSPDHLPVERFVPPAEFDALERQARAMGFAAVAAGPFVRSSYRAAELRLAIDTEISPQRSQRTQSCLYCKNS